MDNLEDTANDKLKEVAREISNELKFTSSYVEDKNIKMHKIIDGKRIWNWSSVIVGGGLSIGAGVAYFVGAAAAGPLGWAALAVTGIGILGSYFFKSRDKKNMKHELDLKIT